MKNPMSKDVFHCWSWEGLSERLQGTYSVTVVFVLAGILLWNTSFSYTQISCSCPAHFPNSAVDYANKVCWSTNVHYLPRNSSSPKTDANLIPHFNAAKYSVFLAIGLALLLLLPKALGRFTMRTFGTSINSIFELASDSTTGKNTSDHEAKMSKAILEFMEAAPSSYYLTVIYGFVKLTYLIVGITQIVLIERFLDVRLIDIIKGLVYPPANSPDDNTVLFSSRFPADVMCTYEVRHIGNIHRYTVQCTLPANQLHEKLWILFLFWIVAITIVGAFSLTKFTLQSLIQTYHVRYVSHRLSMKGSIQDGSDPQVWLFVQSVLGRDGFLLLRLMSDNVGEGTTIQVMDRLWEKWVSSRADNRSESSNFESDGLRMN